MEFIVENWSVLVALLACGMVLGVGIYHFVQMPPNKQLGKVREWLLWAVTEAEKELGGGTGKLKLRHVYDLFVVRFPWLAKVVSFELFSTLVDEALVDMRAMLQNNEDVKSYVEGEQK